MTAESLSTVVVELESGKRPKGGVSADTGTIPSLGGEHLNNDGGFNFNNLKYIDEIFFNSLKKGTIKKKDILIVKDGATTGKISFVDDSFPFEKAAINEHLFSLRVNRELADPKYVFLFLKSPQGQKQILKDFRGAAIGGISRGFVELAKIPIPPFNDQIRIAHLLSKVEGLIVQRKQDLFQLDELLKSVFLDMFGDPVRNEKGWDKPELKEFGSISTGNTPPRKDSSNYSPSHIEWIKTDNITPDSIYVTQAAEFLSELGVTRGRTVATDALLVACIAGSVASIGRAALTDRRVAFNQQINAIQPYSDVNPLYLYMLFKMSMAYVQSHATKGMKKILTKGKFEKIRMLKPPIDLQKRYAAVVEKVEGTKLLYRQSLAELENLYGAMSQKAFKGELDLSRVTLLPEEREKVQAIQTTTVAAEHPKAFELPDPAHVSDLTEAEGRMKVIALWLDSYFGQLDSMSFSAQDFMEKAQQKLWELLQDDSYQLSIAEYDHVKKWVFDALESGRLSQNFDSDGNRVLVTAAKGA